MRSVALSTGFRLAAAGLAVVATLAACSTDKNQPSETTVSTPTSGAPTPSSTPASATPTDKVIPSLNPSGPQSVTPSGAGPRPATPLPGKGPEGSQ